MSQMPHSEGEDLPAQSFRRWLIVVVGLCLAITAAIIGMIKLAQLLNEPQYKSIDEIDPANIRYMNILIINKPDESPDISAGGKEPFVVPEEFHSAVLAPLLKAKVIDTDRGVYMGQINLGFQDGRKLEVLLYRVAADSRDASKQTLRFKIEEHQFEVASLDSFLKPLSEVEAKARSRR